MMNIDLKRELDSKITKSFLSNSLNMKIVFKIVNMLGKEMSQSSTLKSLHFYLKGGNSFDLLKGNQLSGDFDFQLCLRKESYENVTNWKEDIVLIDNKLQEILEKVCMQYDEICKQIENEQCDNQKKDKINFQVENIFNEKIDDYDSGQFSTGHMLIGKSYLENTYSQIISKINLQKGETRLNINKNEIESQTNDSDSPQPMWYVNYTIPGFILYRIVLRRAYKKGNEIEHLKSEIIDISIPRYGSNEVYMSQENVITHFQNVSVIDQRLFGFKLPGWGYHFYENLNLLQEIILGISGSKHKREKRITRGKDALEKLLEKNDNSLEKILTQDRIKENENDTILGLVSAYVHNIDTYNVLNGNMMNDIKNKIKGFYMSELKSSQFKVKQKNLFLYLVEFQTRNNVLNNMIMFKDLKNAVDEIKKLGAVTPKPHFLIYNFDKTKLIGNDEIPIRFLVMNVDSYNYNKIKNEYMRINGEKDVIEFDNQCYFVLRMGGGNCYLIMNHNLNGNAISYEQILERTLIQSQRYRLALAYNKMEKEM